MRDVIEIETERLRLRRLALSDAPRVARLAGDPSVARMIARTPLPYLEVAAEGWILTTLARGAVLEDYVYALDLPREGLIGVIGVHRDHEAQRPRYEVGYWVGRPYWGEGFATEALRALVSEAHALGPLHAGHFIDNPASGRVLRKAGFDYTGEIARTFSMARGEAAPAKRMMFAGPQAMRSVREASLAH